MAYTKQTWDTTSIFNPTRMNHIEDGIAEATTPTAEGISVTPNTTYTGTFVVRAYLFGRFFFITGYMQISAQVPNNTQIATINLNGKTLLQELYITAKASDTSDVVRMKITTDGKLQSESIIPNGNYYSFSCFGVLSV